MFLTDIYNHCGEKEEEADQTLQVSRKVLCSDFLAKTKMLHLMLMPGRTWYSRIVVVGIGDFVVVVLVLVASDVLDAVAADVLGAGGNPRVHA